MHIQGLKEYINEAKKLRKKFVKDEESILQRLIDGDDSVRIRLVEGNLLLVVKISYDFRYRGMPLWDLISEGNSTLINASEIFDAKRGSKFSSYLGVAVRRKFASALATRGSLIKPGNTGGIQCVMKVRHWANEWKRVNGSEPTIEEIHEEFPDFSNIQIKHFLLSLVDGVRDSEDFNVIENLYISTQEVSDRFRRQELGGYLEKLMQEKLDKRTIDIVKKRAGIGFDPHTLEQVAKGYGLTRERIRQIYFLGLKELRKHIDPSTLDHIKYQQQTEVHTNGNFS